jgi:hypothetical protein
LVNLLSTIHTFCVSEYSHWRKKPEIGDRASDVGNAGGQTARLFKKNGLSAGSRPVPKKLQELYFAAKFLIAVSEP